MIFLTGELLNNERNTGTGVFHLQDLREKA